jgi:hypothetical protein
MSRLEHYASLEEVQGGAGPDWFKHFWDQWEHDTTDDSAPHPKLEAPIVLFIPQQSEKGLMPSLAGVDGLVFWRFDDTICAIQVYNVSHPNFGAGT